MQRKEQSLEAVLRKKGCFLVPNRFLNKIQQFTDIDNNAAIYKMSKKHERNCYTFTQNIEQRLRYLGIIYPSGRVVVKELYKININKKTYTIKFFIKKSRRSTIKAFFLNEVIDE